MFLRHILKPKVILRLDIIYRSRLYIESIDCTIESAYVTTLESCWSLKRSWPLLKCMRRRHLVNLTWLMTLCDHTSIPVESSNLRRCGGSSNHLFEACHATMVGAIVSPRTATSYQFIRRGAPARSTDHSEVRACPGGNVPYGDSAQIIMPPAPLSRTVAICQTVPGAITAAGVDDMH